MSKTTSKILALCGGVGGAKLALGLTHVLQPEQLTIAVNTGDDFNHFGLRICPDLDTVMYTLGEVNNKTQGWGREQEQWTVFETLKTLGAETWFQLGDKDLAVHLQRRQLLDQGLSLSQATAALFRQFGIRHRVVPMTDGPVSTVVETEQGDLAFQHYFVRERCEPRITGYRFDGVDQAAPSEGLQQALADEDLAGIIICPSNPFVSVEPILSIPSVRELIIRREIPVIAVSPIVGGVALKGPAAKMFTELGLPSSNGGVAAFYGDLLRGLVVDENDRERDGTSPSACPFHYCKTVMASLQDRIDLANECLAFLGSLSKESLAK